MTDQTPMEATESRLTDQARQCLGVARSMFMFGELSEEDLRGYLKSHLGFSSESAEEYVLACGDANDGDPAEERPSAAAKAACQLPPQSPVERRRGTLRPRYGPQPS